MERVVALARHCRRQQADDAPENALRGHASPGKRHVEQVLANGLRQMPHSSSELWGIDQLQAATAVHSLMTTFIASQRLRGCGVSGRE